MPKRREPGTGSIHQRPNGSWCGQVSVGYAAGGRYRRTVYGRTQQEVEEKIARVLADPVVAQRHPLKINRPGNPLSRDEQLKAAIATETHTIEQWEAKRDAIGCCVYCGDPGPTVVDHVIPLARGGTNGLGNVVPACQVCNSAKGSDTAYEFMRRKLLT